MDDVCLIAAPRPLRLFNPPSVHHHNNSSNNGPHHHVVVPRARPIFSPVEAFAKFSLEDSPTNAIDETDEPDSSTSSSSNDSNTRLSLPEETLEEFLAILRPPTSLPPFRFNHHHHHRRQALGSSSSSSSSSSSTHPYERPHPYRLRKSVSTISSGATEETDRTSRSRRGVDGREKLSVSVGLSRRSDVDTPLTTSMDEVVGQADWRNFELGSPISRNQTRNPLPRHPSYEALTANLFVSVSVTTMPVSPLLRPTRNIIDNLHPHPHPHLSSSSSSHIRPGPGSTTSTEEAVVLPNVHIPVSISSGQGQ